MSSQTLAVAEFFWREIVATTATPAEPTWTNAAVGQEFWCVKTSIIYNGWMHVQVGEILFPVYLTFEHIFAGQRRIKTVKYTCGRRQSRKACVVIFLFILVE